MSSFGQVGMIKTFLMSSSMIVSCTIVTWMREQPSMEILSRKTEGMWPVSISIKCMGSNFIHFSTKSPKSPLHKYFSKGTCNQGCHKVPRIFYHAKAHVLDARNHTIPRKTCNSKFPIVQVGIIMLLFRQLGVVVEKMLLPFTPWSYL